MWDRVYSNIERELLGVLFSVLHFKHFTYGRKVHIITDHKPLVSLFRKSLTSASPRLSRMLLCILDYQLEAMYQPGTKMHLSDALSRLTSHNDNSKAKSIQGLDITVHDVQVFTEISPLSLEKIKHVTENDPDLKTLKQYIQDGDRVSYLSHAPFIIQNARVVDLLLNSYKMRFGGLIV